MPVELAAARLTVERGLTAPGSKVTYNFRSGPGMGLLIASENDLQSLIDNPQVKSFGIAHKLEPMLNDSREITGANSAFVAGYSGVGRMVAMLDSGIDGAHVDLSSSIVDEACFCAANSCCPGGTVHAFGAGAAAEADTTDGHGTHVAGIITSDGTIAPRGVAPDTDIIAVRVLEGGDTNDAVAALEWLGLYHPGIDAVNLSLGSSIGHYADCDTVSTEYESFADAAHALRAAEILAVAASGNLGLKNAMSFPSCISGVISVGATDKNDVPAEFSNANSNLDLLAPGTGFAPLGPGDTCNSVSDCILSTGLGNTTNRQLGTSMATPHVAAAVALLREADEDLTADEIEDCLKSGPLVTDPWWVAPNNHEKPRLDIPAALAACGQPLCFAETYEAEEIYQSVGVAARLRTATFGWIKSQLTVRMKCRPLRVTACAPIPST